MKILLIDDSEVILQYVQTLLEAQGFQVVAASDFAGALDQYSRHHPGAILADFVLAGGRTGLEILMAISAQQSSRGVKLAILTQGALLPSDESRVAAMGAIVIQKPKFGFETDFDRDIARWILAKPA